MSGMGPVQLLMGGAAKSKYDFFLRCVMFRVCQVKYGKDDNHTSEKHYHIQTLFFNKKKNMLNLATFLLLWSYQ